MENNEILNNGNEAAQEQSVEINAAEKPVVTKVDTSIESNSKKPHKRLLVGKVTSNKPDKSIIVSVETQVMHPLYKKYYKVTKKVMAHDEENSCNTGDTVRIKEHRPLSARKRWILEDIIQRAK